MKGKKGQGQEQGQGQGGESTVEGGGSTSTALSLAIGAAAPQSAQTKPPPDTTIASPEKKTVRFVDSSPASPSKVSLQFTPSPSEKALMPNGARFRSAFPKAVLARKMEDLETSNMIQTMKEDAMRFEKKRQNQLSMNSVSKAPSSAAGRSSDASLVRTSSTNLSK